MPYRCPLVQEPEDSLSSRPFGRFPSSSAPAFSPARSLTQVPGSVRVTSANSQLSQFLQLTVFSSPFLALQLALGDSQVWSQPLNSIHAGSHRACGICQAPLLGRLTPKHLSHLPGGALPLSFPTASVVPIAFHSYLLSLTRLHQGSGPGLLFSGLDLRASVWSPRLPCALFLPLHSRLGLPSRVAQLPFRASSLALTKLRATGYASGLRRLQVGATHSTFVIVIQQGVLSDPLLSLRLPNICG